jgi:hypothetical protein
VGRVDVEGPLGVGRREAPSLRVALDEVTETEELR